MVPPVNIGTPEIERALAGDNRAGRTLVQYLMPQVQARVNAALMRRASASGGRVIRQEVLDLSQEVFAHLFAQDGKALRSWQPGREATLKTFVGRIAERRVASIMRSARRSPWTETPIEPSTLDRNESAAHLPEGLVAGREELRAVLDALRANLTPLGFELFGELIVEQRSVAEVCEARQMSPEAVYAWRSRLRKAAREALIEVNA